MKSVFSTTRRSLTALAFGAAIAGMAPTASFAFDEASTSSINVSQEKLAISGYDPVAYFAANQATKGDKKFSATHNGAVYYFASAGNRDAFKANPAKYAPQFGNFCAMGVALGKKLDVDPQAWTVVDGKLYLNVNRDVQVKWKEDIPGNISKAQTNWPVLKDKAPNTL